MIYSQIKTIACDGSDVFWPWIFWLLGAFILGAILGWLLRCILGNCEKEVVKEVIKEVDDGNWKEKYADIKSKLDNCESRKDKLQIDLDNCMKEKVSLSSSALGSNSDEKLKADLKADIGVISESDKEDLKRIKGIGKVFEKKLNEIGIYTFKQIASLKEKGVLAVEELTSFPGRVKRENWIGQAKTLSEGGKTEFSNRVDEGDVDYSDS